MLLDLARADGRIVAVGERGFILYSDDEGETWTQAEVPVSVTLTAVTFPTPQKGWAVGHEGTVLHSADGGASWVVQLDAVAVARQEVSYAEATVQAKTEELEQTEDEDLLMDLEFELEEAQFALEDAAAAVEAGGTTNPFMDVWFADETNGIVVGAYGLIFRTGDGGQSWQIWSEELDNSDKYHYYGLAALDAQTLFLGGEAGMLFRSLDGGLSWERLDSPYEGSFFGVMALRNDQGAHVLAFGLRGNIFRSDDLGDSWQEVPAQSEATLMGGAILHNGHLMLVGRSGAVLTSEDGGQVFNMITREDRNSYSAVLQSRSGGTILVGEGGIYHGDDIGQAR